MRIRLLTIAFAIAMLLGVGTARAQSISGTLTDATSGLPLGNFLTFVYGVQAFDANGQVVGTAFTLQNGLYQIDVPAGTYFVKAFGLGHYYVPELYSNLPCVLSIPTDGSTFRVYVDGVSLGPVSYNFFRSDIATLFPGYANSNGAVGYRVIDTTALEEGLHTITWTVTDSLGAAAGVGSRYFSVSNSAPGTVPSFAAGISAALREQTRTRSPVPARIDGVDLGRRSASLDLLPLDDGGRRVLAVSPADRLALALEHAAPDGCPASWSGYHVVAGETRALPAGSALDPAGIFSWQPGPAFGGAHDLVFVRTSCDGQRLRATVRVDIGPVDNPR